jgi:galactose mutarotase-like enzyme
MDLDVNADWTYRGLRAVLLENRLLRIIILPDLGAKIWQITYKPRDADLLWNNPRVPAQRQPINSRYDDVWCGGWDELFPNDEAGCIDGESYPDHGEVWTGEWQAKPFRNGNEVGVALTFTTPISGISFEKRIHLRRDSAQIHFRHVLHNPTTSPFSFLWKLHPAFAVTAQHRIDFPAMRVNVEPAFLGTLGGAPLRFDWPHVTIGPRQVDLRRIPPRSERQLYFFYGSEMQDGWCALTDTVSGLACGLRFDSQVFPTCWLFASYGGWRNHHVAVLEPCTGYPLNFDAMRAAGRHRTLAAGEVLSTDVRFVVQEGVQAVTRIDLDGRIVST